MWRLRWILKAAKVCVGTPVLILGAGALLGSLDQDWRSCLLFVGLLLYVPEEIIESFEDLCSYGRQVPGK
jgi:hypothetical protein